jgi:hypothetical protein
LHTTAERGSKTRSSEVSIAALLHSGRNALLSYRVATALSFVSQLSVPLIYDTGQGEIWEP